MRCHLEKEIWSQCVEGLRRSERIEEYLQRVIELLSRESGVVSVNWGVLVPLTLHLKLPEYSQLCLYALYRISEDASNSQ